MSMSNVMKENLFNTIMADIALCSFVDDVVGEENRKIKIIQVSDVKAILTKYLLKENHV